MRGITETQEKVVIKTITKNQIGLKKIGFFLWMAFALITLAFYYRQVWHLFTWGPVLWIQENHSLNSFFLPIWRIIQTGGWVFPPSYFAEALQRGLLGMWGVSVILLCSYFLGFAILKGIRVELVDTIDALLYRFGLGFGALSYISFGLAGISLYQPGIIRIVLLTLLGAGLSYTIYELLTRRNVLTRSFTTLSFSLRHGKPWKLVTLLAITIAFVGALAPEIEYDALWYHLWLPSQWLQQGSPIDIVQEYISLYPLTWEMIYGIAMVFGGPIAAKLVHFSMLPLTALLVLQISRFAAPKASPWVAVALFVTIPTIIWQATTTYIDLALTFYIGIAIYVLLQYTRKNRLSYLVLAAIFLGLALAIKHLALIVWLLAISGVGFWLWLEKRCWRNALQVVLILGGISLLFPLPWYLRSWAASGNPFFPDLYSLFGAFPIERWNQITEIGLNNFKDNFGFPRTPLNLALLPWNLTIHAAQFGGSLGPILLLLLTGLFVIKPAGKELRWLGIFSFCYLVLWASPVSSLQMRFLLPITPFLVVLGAAAIEELTTRLEGRRLGLHLVRWILLVLLVLNLPPFTSLHETDRVQWNGWLTHVIHDIPLGVVLGYEFEGDYLARKVPSFRAWDYINNNLPLDARVLTFSGGDHLYSNRARISSDAAAAHRAVWGAGRDKEEQALQALEDLEITHILFDQQKLDSGALDSLALTQESSLNSWYEVEYEDERYFLARLRWQQIAP